MESNRIQRPAQNSRKDFFISYNKADRHWAEWIAWQLEVEGYSTVLQVWDFRPGTNFVLEMDEATKEADCTIAVLSPDYLDAPNPKAEWAAAFKRDPAGKSRGLLPVRVRECDLTGLLAQIVYVDLVGLDETAARKALIAGVRGGRAKPTTPPRFPHATQGKGGTAPTEETLNLLSDQPPFPRGLPLTTKAIEVFFCYAPEDEELRSKLEKHLALLKRGGLISGWYVGEIGAGKEWRREIDEHLNRAGIVLLLISPDFMASDECFDIVKLAMDRLKSGRTQVIPIILRPVEWHEAPFGKLLPLPKGGKPVTMWQDRDEAFQDVARGIRKAVEEILTGAEPSRGAISNNNPSVVPSPETISEIEASFASKNWPEVIHKASEAIKRAPGHVPYAIYFMQGVAFFKEGKLQEAHDALYTALTPVHEREQRLKVLGSYAAVLNAQGLWDELQTVAEEALRLTSGNSQPWLNVRQQALAKQAGQQFGGYQLTRSLGKGAFSETYLGEHIFKKDSAAVKLFHISLSGGDRAEFIGEASNIAKLVHPNIVRIFDFGVHQGKPFLIMEYLPKGSVRYAKGESLPPNKIKFYVKRVAEALQYVHDRNFVHCNIKPENILIGINQEIRLSDFRIATLNRYMQSAANKTIYAAPEQLAGKPCPASDQYALGIIIYEWITGGLPTADELNYFEMSKQLSTIFPSPLRQRFPNISSSFEKTLVKVLSRDPDKRFDQVRDFADAIEQTL